MVCDDTTFLPDEQWPPYRRMYIEEQGFRQPGRTLPDLLRIFQCCPQLREIVITDFSDGSLRPLYRYPDRTDRYGLAMWHTSYPEPQPWGFLDVANVWDPRWTPYYMFVVLMRALSANNHRIHTLEIKGKYMGISHRLFNMAPTDFHCVTRVFASLTRLDLTIDTHASDVGWLSHTVRRGLLARALEQAANLELLELRFIGHDLDLYGYDVAVFDLAAGLPSSIWPHLRHFGLLHVDLEDHYALAAFMKRHINTLRSLYLDYIFLMHTTWEAALDDFRAQGVQLDSCKTVALFDDRQDTGLEGPNVINFLRGDEPNPCSSS